LRWFFEQKLGGEWLCMTTISPMRELVYGMQKLDERCVIAIEWSMFRLKKKFQLFSSIDDGATEVDPLLSWAWSVKQKETLHGDCFS